MQFSLSLILSPKRSFKIKPLVAIQTAFATMLVEVRRELNILRDTH